MSEISYHPSTRATKYPTFFRRCWQCKEFFVTHRKQAVWCSQDCSKEAMRLNESREPAIP